MPVIATQIWMMKVSSLPCNAVAPVSKQQTWINFISPQCNFNVCNWQTREKYEPHKLMTRFLRARLRALDASSRGRYHFNSTAIKCCSYAWSNVQKPFVNIRAPNNKRKTNANNICVFQLILALGLALQQSRIRQYMLWSFTLESYQTWERRCRSTFVIGMNLCELHMIALFR